MSRIRVALIGLSASAVTSWANEAHLPYLLSERGRQQYEIVALLNSSVSAAEKSRDFFKLPATVRAYGSAEDLARDASLIDLAVVNTRVDRHAIVADPLAAAGVPLYVEWPLTKDLASSHRLLSLFPDPQVARRSIVGLQNRVAPWIETVKEQLAAGAIGTLLSSDVNMNFNYAGRDVLIDGLAYFADRKVGGNPITIAYSHFVDAIHDTVGHWATSTKPSAGDAGATTPDFAFQSHGQITWPEITILGDDRQPLRTITSDVPDRLSVAGVLAPGSSVEGTRIAIQPGAQLTINFRKGSPFPGTPTWTWNIVGSKGQLRITSSSHEFLQPLADASAPRIELHDYASDKVTHVPWQWTAWQDQLPARARTVAIVYDRYYQASVAAAERGGWDAVVGIKGEDNNNNNNNNNNNSSSSQLTSLPTLPGLPPTQRWPTLPDAYGLMQEIGAVWTQWDRQQQQEQQ